jgi:hypothetical protein
MDCAFHVVARDPDPNDWFCDDDEAVLCSKMPASKELPHKAVTVACRPYNKRKECETPKWCPLR